MGHLVNLVLRGSSLPYLSEEDEEDIVWLSAKNGLPLFWLSLLTQDDLHGEWERDVRACHADPDECGDGLPPIRIGWASARAMLAHAEVRADRRVPTLAPMFARWADALRTLADAGPTQEVRLDLGAYANFSARIDDFLADLSTGVAIWHGDDAVTLPTIVSVEHDLTGMDDRTGTAFSEAMPRWQAGRPPPGLDASHGSPAGRWESALDWGMALLCTGAILGGAMVGGRLYDTTGQWIGGLVGLVGFASLTWRWARYRQRR